MADEIRAGHLRALIVAGGSPLTAFPDPVGTRAALESLDTLAVLDVVTNPLTELATHVFPTTSQLERADLSMLENVAIRNGTAFTHAAVEAGASRRPGWWVLAQVARRLGLDALGGDREPDELDDLAVLRGLARGARLPFDEIVAGGPHGTTSDPRVGWVHDTVLPDGSWRVAPAELISRLAVTAAEYPSAPALVVAPKRQVRTMNATAYGTPDPVVVGLHPLDATAAGVQAHERVRITSRWGSIEGHLEQDDRVGRGTVALTHGRAELPVAALISPIDGVDPLTGMPLTSGVVVSIEAGSTTVPTDGDPP